jgi:hypothetical protein
MAITQAEIETAERAIIEAGYNPATARAIGEIALEAAERVRWQPIEAKHKDGDDWLVWARPSHCPCDPFKRYVAHYSRGWWTNTHPPMVLHATHCQPLPSPPEQP